VTDRPTYPDREEGVVPTGFAGDRSTLDVDESAFEQGARAFFTARAKPRSAVASDAAGDDVNVLSDRSEEDEALDIAAARSWRRELFDAGFGWVNGPAAYGGAGLGAAEARRFRQIEAEYDGPDQGSFIVGLGIVAPAILEHGTDEQKDFFLRALFRADQFACQLFSEPSNGSDLAGVTTRAVLDGDEWRVDGQKVWNSSAQFSELGLLLARTNPEAPKHQGLTMFLIDMHQPGVDVRPLRQMTGGAHFNEVFLSDARVPDSRRLGGVGDGWRVAITTLMSEREAVGASNETPPEALVDRLIQLLADSGIASAAQAAKRRDEVARAAVLARVLDLTNRRLIEAAHGHPGPEMSITKLLRNQFLAAAVDTACAIAGAAAVADTDAQKYAWGRARLGLPGLRIAGGTDEIQRNILSERVLGMPREPIAAT
jgi:alkylation response protein AidB-like acyl-CoA dehydrogenase